MTLTKIILTLILGGAMLPCFGAVVHAQTEREIESDASISPKPKQSPLVNRKYGNVSLDVLPGVEISLGNRSTGRITIIGWDKNVVSARAFSERGDEVVSYGSVVDGPEQKIFIKSDYADFESADRISRILELPPVNAEGPIQIHLEVSLPKQAAIQIIKVIRSSVQITNVQTPINVFGDQSSIVLKQVGPVEVHTRVGDIEVDGSTGFVEATSSTGAIRISNARGGIGATSIAGPIEVKCARGRVDVNSTTGPIDLYDVEGDVGVSASNSNVRLISGLRQDGRYVLKSMSGKVEMVLPSNTNGFNATLTSYRGTVESDFPLKAPRNDVTNVSRPQDVEYRPRMSGQFGKGGPQIILDSFEGVVRLTKGKNSTNTCK